MEIELLARIALSRLRLPVPLIKLAAANALANALQDESVGQIVWAELLKWIDGLELESEVLEALSVVLMGSNAPVVSVAQLKRAVKKPSPLSDLFFEWISGTETRLISWGNSHSGEVSDLFRSKAVLEGLRDARFAPPIIWNRLEGLQQKSGRPFLKQWAFEFDNLSRRFSGDAEVDCQYFFGSERKATGQFIVHRSHVTRSAFLRTLSLAFDRWAMPAEIARSESLYATPVSLSFARTIPGVEPPIFSQRGESSPASQEHWGAFVSELLKVSNGLHQHLLHLDAPLNGNAVYRAKLEIVSCLCAAAKPDPDEVFSLHEFLPGRIGPTEDRDGSLLIHGHEPYLFRCKRGGHFVPAVMPSVVEHAGYFHSDLLQRMPFLPANYSKDAVLLCRFGDGGAEMSLDSAVCGTVNYWNTQWAPTFHKEIGPGCCVASRVSQDCVNRILAIPDMKLVRYWRATVLNRERDYGEWTTSVMAGQVDLDSIA